MSNLKKDIDEILGELEPFTELTNDLDEWHESKREATTQILNLIKSVIPKKYSVVKDRDMLMARVPEIAKKGLSEVELEAIMIGGVVAHNALIDDIKSKLIEKETR